MFWITSKVKSQGWQLHEKIESLCKAGREESFEQLLQGFGDSPHYSEVRREGNQIILRDLETGFGFQMPKNHVTGGLTEVMAIGVGQYCGVCPTRDVDQEMATVYLRRQPTIKARQLKSFFVKYLNFMDLGNLSGC